jgi:hypothetical protein
MTLLMAIRLRSWWLPSTRVPGQVVLAWGGAVNT